MYQVVIIPLFDNCDVVWTPCLAKQVRVMKRITLKLLLLCSTCERSSSCFYYSLVKRRKFHTLIQLFRILHKMAYINVEKVANRGNDEKFGSYAVIYRLIAAATITFIK